MLSRRLIRIKTLQALYSYRQQEGDNWMKGRDQLTAGIFIFGECFLHLMQLPAALRSFLQSAAEIEQQKFFPDKDKLRRCALLNSVEPVMQLEQAVAASGLSCRYTWDQAALSFDTLWEDLQEQASVKDYLIFDAPPYTMQKDFLLSFFDYLMNASEFFNDLMEETYPAWYDDEVQLWRVTEKTLKSLQEDKPAQLPAPLRRSDEEVEFACRLFELVTRESETLESHIKPSSSNWETDRIAMVDMIILKMALAEMLWFEHIPVKVTINEYLDIAKNYSTPNSSRFINGVLDRLRLELQTEGRIVKSGRGLREN